MPSSNLPVLEIIFIMHGPDPDPELNIDPTNLPIMTVGSDGKTYTVINGFNLVEDALGYSFDNLGTDSIYRMRLAINMLSPMAQNFSQANQTGLVA